MHYFKANLRPYHTRARKRTVPSKREHFVKPTLVIFVLVKKAVNHNSLTEQPQWTEQLNAEKRTNQKELNVFVRTVTAAAERFSRCVSTFINKIINHVVFLNVKMS